MAILASHIHFLSMQNKEHPINGDVLTLGQQGVYTDIENVKKIINQYEAVKTISGIDTKPKIKSWIGGELEKNTNAHCVFTLLGAKNVYSCDYSNYEAPDYIFDLNYPVDKKFKEKFDVIFDSGTLEHIFDVPTALNNLNYMLKKGGKIIIFSPCSNSVDHGFYSFSPTLFFDYFQNKGYENTTGYLRETNPYAKGYKGKSYKYSEVGDQLVLFSKLSIELYFFAIKGHNDQVTPETKPIQTLYKNVYSESNIRDSRNQSLRSLYRKFHNYFPPQVKLFLNQHFKKKANIKYIGKY